MVTCRCTEKIRDKQGKIIGYILEDSNGACIKVSPLDLKRQIISKEFNVINLKLTSDGRLIDIKEKVHSKSNQNKQDIRLLITKHILDSDLGKLVLPYQNDIKVTNHIIVDNVSYNKWQTMLEEDYPPLGVLKCGIDTEDACEYGLESEWFKEYTLKNSIETLKNQILSVGIHRNYGEDYTVINWYLTLMENNTWAFQLIVNTSEETDYINEAGAVYSLEDTIEGKDIHSIVRTILNKNFSINDICH